MTDFPNRRRTLRWMGAAALAPWLPGTAFAQELRPMPSSTEGPFYPRTFPADKDNDLTRVAGAAGVAGGTILDLSGRILDRRGKPLAGAMIEIWQCDIHGNYHHVGESQALDPNFQGWGTDVVDAEGRYRFRTIRPVPYSGRTAHIHYTVRVGAKRVFTSQMYVEGDAGNERDFLYRSLGKDAKLATMKLEDAAANSGAKVKGVLDIVVVA
jgi:protocatechuate 3,4-dioxygenase beta subunit